MGGGKNEWQDDCDKFNGCLFVVKQMPKYPQHPNCQCRLQKVDKPIPNVTAKAVCNVSKFVDYFFNEQSNKGKKAIFEGLGFSKTDSEYL